MIKRNLMIFVTGLAIGWTLVDVLTAEGADAGPGAAAPAAPEAAPAAEAPTPAAPEIPDLSNLDVPPAPPIDMPGGRPSLILLLAFLINRALWMLKKGAGSFFPERLHPYLPLIAAGLGLVYAVIENVTQGTPWTWAILTGIAGSTGAVAWREGTRAMSHAKNAPPKGPPPKAPTVMTDDELADAAKKG